MFKYALQASTNSTVESVRSFAAAANVQLFIKNAFSKLDRRHNIGTTTLLFMIDACGSFKSHERGSRDLAYVFTSLSKKTRRSKYLQMLEQMRHILFNYFKTLSVGPAGNRTRVPRKRDWHFTN